LAIDTFYDTTISEVWILVKNIMLVGQKGGRAGRCYIHNPGCHLRCEQATKDYLLWWTARRCAQHRAA